MVDCRCYIIPPHLLRAIAESEEVSENTREFAKDALVHRNEITEKRHSYFAMLTQPRGYAAAAGIHAPIRQNIITPDILNSLANAEDVDEETRECAKRDLEHLSSVHDRVHAFQEGSATSQQQGLAAAAAPKKKAPSKAYRSVYTANNSPSESKLPGKLVRKEGQKPISDASANEAYDGVGDVIDMYGKFFNWKSIDNQNMPVVSTVHFGRAYENAFWDPERAQMVFGDGGEFIGAFTKAIDVIGHEMTHAVTEHTSPLDYYGQAGALNEHISDVFGIMIKQWKQDETSENADWLIGEDCLLPGVKGVALRSMKEPGSAYDDPRFGKDPQPDNFKDFKAMDEDNGGVHIFSGIPNKAFYLASVAFGSYSWEKAGQIWWKTMNKGVIPPRCTFLQFADATVETAKELFSDEGAKIVRKAWEDVGVTRDV